MIRKLKRGRDKVVHNVSRWTKIYDPAFCQKQQLVEEGISCWRWLMDCTDYLWVQSSKPMHATTRQKKEVMRIIEKAEPPGREGLILVN